MPILIQAYLVILTRNLQYLVDFGFQGFKNFLPCFFLSRLIKLFQYFLNTKLPIYISSRRFVGWVNNTGNLIEISWEIFWPSLYLPNLCKSLLREPKTFDIKTIFARRETIFGNLFTFSRRVVAAQLSSQQQTFKDKQIKLLMKCAIVIVGQSI